MEDNHEDQRDSVFQMLATCSEDSFSIDGNKIVYNKTPKRFGITLNERLEYTKHLENTEKKASRALRVIREVKEIGNISTKTLIRLYNTMLRSILEYGSTIWQCSKSVEMFN